MLAESRRARLYSVANAGGSAARASPTNNVRARIACFMARGENRGEEGEKMADTITAINRRWHAQKARRALIIASARATSGRLAAKMPLKLALTKIGPSDYILRTYVRGK